MGGEFFDGRRDLFSGQRLGLENEVTDLECAEAGCDGLLRLMPSEVSRSRVYYQCSRWPDCDGSLPANKDGSPRGEPRSKELQRWRHRAHQEFDKIWKEGHCSRRRAYKWLTLQLGMGTEAHMAEMDIETCKRVILAVAMKGPGTDVWKGWLKRERRRRRNRRR